MTDGYDIERRKWDEKSRQLLKKQGVDWQVTQTYESEFKLRPMLRPVYDFFGAVDNAVVLDYGCGGGWSAMLFASKASRVKAFDISEGRIEVLKKKMAANHVTNIDPSVENGEALPYADDTFDVVFGNAILHHIRLDRCLPEIHRVLKPGGKAAFCEPFAHNPVINLFRYVKHHFVEDHVGTDNPLTYKDITLFRQHFSHVQFVESSFFRDRFTSLVHLDRALLTIPWLRKYVAYITILLKK